MKKNTIGLLGLFLAPLILLNSCGKQPVSTITLDLSLPKNVSSTNKSLSKNKLKSASVTYLPVQIYLKVVDNTNATLYEGVVPIGNYADGSYKEAPSVTLANVDP
ncbi:MAG: hypothetical protein V4591_08415, partial [Bdellovibrionota bacterium]